MTILDFAKRLFKEKGGLCNYVGLFDDGGEVGFCLLWLIRLANGRPAPFGPVLGYGEDNVFAPSTYYVAYFSLRTMPPSTKDTDGVRLCPALMVETARPYHVSLTWAHRGWSDEVGGTFTPIPYAEIPRHIQRQFCAFLGDDYPHTPRGRR